MTALQQLKLCYFFLLGNTELVYSGMMAGGSFDQRGAAVNNLCITLHPVFGEHKNIYYSFLYGTEFETHDALQDKVKRVKNENAIRTTI